MFPVLIALLLAAWVFQPWSYVDQVNVPVFEANAESRSYQRDPSFYLSSAARLNRLFLLDARAAAAAQPTVAPTPTPPATPTPAPTPAPAPSPSPSPPVPLFILSSEELRSLICSYSWPCEEALRVKWCESGSRWDAIGAGSNYGGFQINAIHARRIPDFWTSWMDPVKNTAWAFDIWSRQGWKPWGCRPY